MTVYTFPRRPLVVGHRGAAAYAPENTIASYDLAVRPGADGIELDLNVTRDGVLVCIHDRTLDRTTDVAEQFRGREREDPGGAIAGRHWFVHDFTSDELTPLGVPTFGEVVAWARGRTGLLVELKDPEVYERLGIDLLALFQDAASHHGLDNADQWNGTVTVQSFHEPTVRRAGDLYRGRMPVALLCEHAEAIACANPGRMTDIATFATGLNPEKSALTERPELVRLAHDAGLTVMPWVFSATSPGQGFPTVQGEIASYLTELGGDGVITNNPDLAHLAGIAGRTRRP